MAMKLMVFDVDGTLAKTEESIPPHIARKLRELERDGQQIVLISGRTASYLAGLARGMGLRNPLVAGENGGVLFDPIHLWERRLDFIPPEIITAMRENLLQEFGELWFQPNQTMLTAAPRDLGRIEELYQTVLRLKQVTENNYKLNKYYDSVEIMPKENSKGRALAVFKEILNINREEVIVFGNTVVDLPMNSETKEFYLIGESVTYPEIASYPTMEDAFRYLDSITDNS